MSIFYDAIIYGFLALDGLLICFSIYSVGNLRFPTRARRLSLFVFIAALFSWFVIFYGSFIEPQLLVVTKQKIQLKPTAVEDERSFDLVGRRARGGNVVSPRIKVVLISDFHLGPYKGQAWVKKVVAKVSSLAPDLILIGGDFLLEEKVIIEDFAPLKNLNAPLGVYAVLGNHDYREGEFYELLNYPFDGNKRVQTVVKALKNAGIRLLKNESVEIDLPNGKKVLLGGVDEYWTGRADVAKTFSSQAAGAAISKILLVHNPDIIHKAQQFGVDLVLAAHTHGGQIRLPWFGSVPPIPDQLGKKYDRGLFQFGKTQLFITSGLGETGPRSRLLVPPEIAILEII